MKYNSNKLMILRLQNGLPSAQLCQMINLDEKTYYDMEHGVTEATDEIIDKLSRYYSVDPTYFLENKITKQIIENKSAEPTEPAQAVSQNSTATLTAKPIEQPQTVPQNPTVTITPKPVENQPPMKFTESLKDLPDFSKEEITVMKPQRRVVVPRADEIPDLHTQFDDDIHNTKVTVRLDPNHIVNIVLLLLIAIQAVLFFLLPVGSVLNQTYTCYDFMMEDFGNLFTNIFSGLFLFGIFIDFLANILLFFVKHNEVMSKLNLFVQFLSGMVETVVLVNFVLTYAPNVFSFSTVYHYFALAFVFISVLSFAGKIVLSKMSKKRS